ncbi:MAG: hypothetical protein DSZ24_01690 [Thermodesulfatator sp.]|nr:MAG: hypothetical protein DSZ24_01690 [Thermodesulfatator sp.]
MKSVIPGLLSHPGPPLSLAGAFVLSFLALAVLVWWRDRRLREALQRLQRRLAEVNSLEDLSELENLAEGRPYRDAPLLPPLQELDSVIRKLVTRLREIAVDKKFLEFEMGLAEKLLLTPEILREWPQVLRDLVGKLTEFFPYFYLFLAFQQGERVEGRVFACCPDLLNHRAQIEEALKRELEKQGFLQGQTSLHLEFEDLWAERDEKREFLSAEISQICKVLTLEKHKLQGAAGLGLPSTVELTESQLLALEALLTAILNLSVSVRTLEAYTLHLEFHASRDPLTGLYNRRAFQEFLQVEMDRARRQNYSFALLFIDVDHFKLLNDAYGHVVGDQFLRHLALFLRRIFRRGDILARHGGDEFVALVPHIDCYGLPRILERLFAAFKRFSFRTPDGKEVSASLSVGAALFPEHAQTPERLLSLADRAMYRAKELGKGRWAFPSEEDLSLSEEEYGKRSLLLLEAVQKGRVVPFFQPILEISTQRIAGYEVLMRILDQEDDFLPASRFIYSAERMGLITRLEEILWEKTLKKVSQSPGDFLLFFNLSPCSLLREEFRQRLKGLLEKHRVDFRRVVVELTERESVRDFSALQRAISELKSWGLALALDDFGSGFSSYRYLKHLPVDYIKLEGEVVRSMLTEEIDRAFVAGAVTLAKLVGVSIVAEFVESEELLEELRRLGVDYAQGYHLGRPLPEL